ncbi:MAG: DUF4416 family protein [Thermovirgaceae bacterium]
MGPMVKLITGILYPDKEHLEWVAERLEELFGPVERTLSGFPFDHTDYYRAIAPRLFKGFFSFRGLRRAGELADWKKDSCELEKRSGSTRKVNIDPGYLDGARLVLASTKDHAHRIYLREGIFAEVTLRYAKKAWRPYDHTFPDFASGTYDAFLDAVRADWLRDVKGEKKG